MTHAQTMSKAKAVEALTEARADLKAAQARERQCEDELRRAVSARDLAQARVEDAKAHLDRAIDKES